MKITSVTNAPTGGHRVEKKSQKQNTIVIKNCRVIECGEITLRQTFNSVEEFYLETAHRHLYISDREQMEILVSMFKEMLTGTK